MNWIALPQAQLHQYAERRYRQEVEVAGRNIKAYSEKVRAGIRKAAEGIPDGRGRYAKVKRRIELRSPEFYGLKRVPNRDTISEALK